MRNADQSHCEVHRDVQRIHPMEWALASCYKTHRTTSNYFLSCFSLHYLLVWNCCHQLLLRPQVKTSTVAKLPTANDLFQLKLCLLFQSQFLRFNLTGNVSDTTGERSVDIEVDSI